jgi:hypothetical protein
MKAQIIKGRSWEKQSWAILENGVTVCVEHNQVYGNFIKCMEKGNVRWDASSGFVLPPEFDFANAWREVVVVSSGSTLIRPKFQTIL